MLFKKLAIFLSVASSLAMAQVAPVMIHVHAPYAQRLILQIKSEHPEISKIGLHAIPPGEPRSAIVASNFPNKIGKLSSAKDKELLATGKPCVTKVDRESIYDLLLPVSDKAGNAVGFVVMEVPFDKASSGQEALQKGVVIRDRIQSQIESKSQLFE